MLACIALGPLAQLAEHLHDAQGVRGSNPLRPTLEVLVRALLAGRPRPGSDCTGTIHLVGWPVMAAMRS